MNFDPTDSPLDKVPAPAAAERGVEMDTRTACELLCALVGDFNMKEALSLIERGLSDPGGVQGVGAALKFYVEEFVIPEYRDGYAVKSKPIPRWVDEALFHPPRVYDPEKVTISQFLAKFPNSVLWALSEKLDYTPRVPPPHVSSEIEPDIFVEEEYVPQAIGARAGLFFSPNGCGQVRSRGGNRKHLANISDFNAIFVDVDGGKTVDKYRALLSRKPSIVVETRNGWHGYWILRHLDRKISAKEWQIVQNVAIKNCGSDEACKDASRLLRLPRTWHGKSEAIFFVRIVHFSDVVYTLREVLALFRQHNLDELLTQEKEKEKKIVEWNEKRKAGLIPTRRYVLPQCVLTPGTRHGRATKEVARLFSNLSEELLPDARAYATAWYHDSCSPLKANWLAEIESIMQWVEDREAARR